MENSNWSSYFDANQKLWDAKTPIHWASSFYDVEGFIKKPNSLNSIETKLLGDLHHQSILHLQCHFGQDTISLAKLGAKAVGIDFSSEAIDHARKLNEELGTDCTFFESNVYNIASLGLGQFDWVFTSYGSICWLPDLETWAKIIFDHLKPGGKFLIVDLHPLLHLLDWTTAQIAYEYDTYGQPIREENQGTYTDGGECLKSVEYFWNHSMSSLISALLKSGLILESLDEFNYCPYDLFGDGSIATESGFAIKNLPKSFPYVYAIACTKPL